MTNVTYFIHKVYIRSYSLIYWLICLYQMTYFMLIPLLASRICSSVTWRKSWHLPGQAEKTMRNFRQDSQPTHLTATLYTFTQSSPSDLPTHVLHINLSRQMYVCLTYTFPWIRTHFISLVTTCYNVSVILTIVRH